MPEKGLSVRDLSVRFGRNTIIRGVSFEVRPGNVAGLVGPNGAGKSTTIHAIAGLVKYTGMIAVNGISVDQKEKYLEKIAVMYDAPMFYPYLSGYDNLMLSVDHNAECNRSEILYWAERLGIASRLCEKVEKYSLGMRQRLSLIRNLCAGADIQILDEPFNGLDPEGITELGRIITECAKEKKIGFVISSHLLNEVGELSDEIYVFHKGTIQKNFCMRDVKDEYLLTLTGEYGGILSRIASSKFETDEKNGRLIVRVEKKELSRLISYLYQNGVEPIAVERVNPLERYYAEITRKIEHD